MVHDGGVKAKGFVAISGLPCSGKTTLAMRLAPALDLPLIDKDAILEELFETQGVGDGAWRRRLSRESDLRFQNEARASGGAILVSFWHLPGMARDSGTPTAWLSTLAGPFVNVHCACAPEIAAQRFLDRQRHPGHLDNRASAAELLAGLRAISCLGGLEIGRRLDVDTSRKPDVDGLVREIAFIFQSLRSHIPLDNG
jgi:predicted kinase